MTGLIDWVRSSPGLPAAVLRQGGRTLLARSLSRAEDQELVDVVGGASGAQAVQLRERLALLLRTLDHPVPPGGVRPLVRAVEAALADADASQVWLALSVLTARLPLDHVVVSVHRRLRLDGPRYAFSQQLAEVLAVSSPDRARPARVSVAVGAVTLDMHHTSQTYLATGIQRVARETARCWARDHDVLLLGWTEGYTALKRLDPAGQRRAVGDLDRSFHVASGASPGNEAPEVVVPWGGTYVVVELATEPPRTSRMLALARWSRNRTCLVGHDCVPLTSAETAGEGMGGAFARLLAAVRHADRVATVSGGSAVEYRGWSAMLGGTGVPGPDIAVVSLPVDALEPSPQALEVARSRFLVGTMPMVLVVGSHEPRKNHLAVLHAAELLWREGREFSLLLVGGNAWNGERFSQALSALRDAGRPVESVSALSDDALWAAYRLAHVVLFPSLSEGFGLPVAEGLASGTPVITSQHGSTAEVAGGGGALLVDPRDDADIAAALRRVLEEPGLHGDLVAEARLRPRRSWDDYAAELWDYLVAT